ncbi:MAG: endolytic transglycosylase MltG [Candidatus Saccharimonadales bacterium]
MAIKRYHSKRRFLPGRVIWLFGIILVLSACGIVAARHVYYQDLLPVGKNQTDHLFTVSQGDTVKNISVKLANDHLIRSAWAFQLYVHSKDLSVQLQAGTYDLAPNQSTPDIVSTLTHGKVSHSLVTILPGRRIGQVRADLINAGFTPKSVDNALDPANYVDLPVLSYKPSNINSLEGLLWPDSYQAQPNTDPVIIVRESLKAMGSHITPDIQQAFAAQGLNSYQAITLASIVVQEVNKPGDQTQAAQVFLSRLKSGMVLGSDVTANYGAIIAGKAPNLSFDSPYNTLIHPGLPPSPISSINQSSLTAVAHPASTNWLYFVAGDDGTTYFSTNYQDHQTQTQQYCHKLCGN